MWLKEDLGGRRSLDDKENTGVDSMEGDSDTEEVAGGEGDSDSVVVLVTCQHQSAESGDDSTKGERHDLSHSEDSMLSKENRLLEGKKVTYGTTNRVHTLERMNEELQTLNAPKALNVSTCFWRKICQNH